KDPNSAYGVTVPDVPGCFSFGDTLDEAVKNTKEAVLGHLEILLEEGDEVALEPSTLEDLVAKEEYQGAVWVMLDIDLSALDSKPERVNISLPKFVLRRIDDYAKANKETRSGFLVRAALAAMH
ncbi:MAG: type II toxin-antitoxin system HicB family antitoxin, partial [Proteobacteria bacterium]|nr:type II toxin-antitoxin system HicB family antitoxin [Pseudomonadota bacterium]